MSSGVTSLLKVLKDETRRNIVLLLNEKGALSYTELMETLGFLTTGLLNYHLKALGDLIAKNEAGQYVLTEKGSMASRLLLEFPETAANGFQGKPKWWRKFWISVGFATSVSLAFNSLMYFLGYLSLTTFYQNSLWIVAAVGIVYMIQHITRDVLSKKTQLLMNKIAYTMLGLWVGLLVAFVGGLLAAYLGGRPDDSFAVLWFLGMLACSIVGGFAGYRFGKKRDFKRPEPKFIGISF